MDSQTSILREKLASTLAQTRASSDVVFIVGISQRSGTNFLNQLLLLHPHCVPSWTYEDFLIRHSNQLIEYAEAVNGSWLPEWGFGEQAIEILCLAIGNGMLSFLERPGVDGRYFVAKTPDPTHIEHFFRFFPNSPLLILIRDGRAVVESGVRGFQWDYESAIQKWGIEAQSIVGFDRKYRKSGHRYMLVRYEELFLHMKVEMEKILDFLGLDIHEYDFDKAANLPVLGSSVFGQSGEFVHFEPVPKTIKFNPLHRWSYWSKSRHARFNWLAGDYLTELGYEMKPPMPTGLWRARNIFQDLSAPANRAIRPSIARVKRVLKRYLWKRALVTSD